MFVCPSLANRRKSDQISLYQGAMEFVNPVVERLDPLNQEYRQYILRMLGKSVGIVDHVTFCRVTQRAEREKRVFVSLAARRIVAMSALCRVLRSTAPRRPFIASCSRAFSTETDTLKPKPKASTPLRRTASASLPIRSNPTPTRSPIRPVLTLATAERYLPTRLRPRLTPDSQKLHDAWWIPRWGQDGEIFVFGNGSFVCWGLSEDEARQFAKDILAPCEVGSLQDPETEELEFVTDPNE